MMTHTAPSRFSEFYSVLRAVRLIAAACLMMPISALAQQPSVATPPGAAGVSLAGLDLTTSAGIAAARKRLHETARRSCSQGADNRQLPDRHGFVSCIDEALIGELKQIKPSTRATIAAQGAVWPTANQTGSLSQETAQDTSVMVVTVADLDVLSPHDARIAQERIRNTARRICGQLTSSQDPASIYAKCVHDATAGALRQINQAALATVVAGHRPFSRTD
jgi:UrcA family protein